MSGRVFVRAEWPGDASGPWLVTDVDEGGRVLRVRWFARRADARNVARDWARARGVEADEGERLPLGVACPACGHLHPLGVSAAVGRFQPGGPVGFVAVGVEGAPVRSTRADASADWCRAGQGRAGEDLQP